MKRVAIIGGGLAGLASAVFLKNSDSYNDFEITIFESTPKLGGRAYSFLDKQTNLFFDNGQHILAGWYKNTFKYLDIIGSSELLYSQKGLEINFIDKNRETFRLKAPEVFAPLNMFIALWKYKAISFGDKLRLRKILKLINIEKFNDELLVSLTALELLTKLKQSNRINEYFWNPFIYAVFNASSENVSAKMFVEILKIGFLKVNSSNLIIPEVDLGKLFIEPSERYFERKNILAKMTSRVQQILTDDEKVTGIKLEDNSEKTFDIVISAVPFFVFKNLFDENVFRNHFSESDKLKPSSITSVHLFFEKNIPSEMLQTNSSGMTGLIGTSVQWIFKRSDRHLSLVISGSDFIKIDNDTVVSDVEKDELIKLIMYELEQCIPGISELKLNGHRIIKEKRATFIPDNDSYNYRPDSESELKNLYIAGDWTNTGLPATIESAIKSSKKISNIILNIN